MDIEKEVEAKVKLTKEEYETIIQNNQGETKVQTNEYYDTPDKTIYNWGGVLRIRSTGQRFELTIKKFESEGEYTEYNFRLIEPIIPVDNQQLDEILDAAGVEPKDLKRLGKMKTTRTSINYSGVLVEVDKSEYNKVTDYEVEIEADTYDNAKRAIRAFCNENDVAQIEKSESKYQRFLATIK